MKKYKYVKTTQKKPFSWLALNIFGKKNKAAFITSVFFCLSAAALLAQSAGPKVSHPQETLGPKEQSIQNLLKEYHQSLRFQENAGQWDNPDVLCYRLTLQK